MHLIASILLLLPAAYGISLIPHLGRAQSLEVIGELKCKERPAPNTLVKLYDKDILLDDKMGETKSGRDGKFQLKGVQWEFTAVDPQVNVYHHCKDGEFTLRCARKITFKIPKEYITAGKTPKKVFDLGVINLAAKPGDETRDCIH